MPQQICAAFLETALTRRESPALSYRSEGVWKTLSWLDYLNWVESIAWGLRGSGIQKESRVGILSSSSWQWSVVDFAALSLQAVTVPIYPSISLGDLQHILRESKLDCVFVENANLLRSLRLALGSLTKKPRIWLLNNSDPDSIDTDSAQSELSWLKLFEMGTEALRQSPQTLRREMQQISPKSFASLHFTSGTSGLPRGVWLQHEQIWSEVHDAFSALGIRAEDRSLSFLPYAHVLGRVEHLGHALIGFHRYQAESIEKLRTHFQEVRPTILVAVPRVFEKIHAAVQTQMQSNSWLKSVSEWAFSIGTEVLQHRESHEPMPWSLAFQNEAAQALFFQNIRQIFGGELRLAVCGGAALPEKIQRDFAASGILILEGYGLTETMAAVTVNLPFDWKSGSVGKPLGDVEIQLAQDGEILVRSRKVFHSYLNEAARDPQSWFATGDLGRLLPSGHLQVTGRKKDLIKTSNGKYVAPQRLESLLVQDSLISSALVLGDQKKYVVALIALDRSAVMSWSQSQGLEEKDYAKLTQLDPIKKEIRNRLRQLNKEVAAHESIKRFLILPEEPSVENGDLTPSLKLRKNVLVEKYKREIDELFFEPGSSKK